jgi:hypothetical protein
MSLDLMHDLLMVATHGKPQTSSLAQRAINEIERLHKLINDLETDLKLEKTAHDRLARYVAEETNPSTRRGL